MGLTYADSKTVDVNTTYWNSGIIIGGIPSPPQFPAASHPRTPIGDPELGIPELASPELETARRIQDEAGIRWACAGILGQAWPKEHHEIEQKARRVAESDVHETSHRVCH